MDANVCVHVCVLSCVELCPSSPTSTSSLYIYMYLRLCFCRCVFLLWCRCEHVGVYLYLPEWECVSWFEMSAFNSHPLWFLFCSAEGEADSVNLSPLRRWRCKSAATVAVSSVRVVVAANVTSWYKSFLLTCVCRRDEASVQSCTSR